MTFIDISLERAGSTDPSWWSAPATAAVIAVGGVLVAQLVAIWIASRRHRHERDLAQTERRATNQRELLLSMHAAAVELYDILTRGAPVWTPWTDEEDIFERNAFGAGTKARPPFRDRLTQFARQRDLIDDNQLRAQLKKIERDYDGLEEERQHPDQESYETWSEAFRAWGMSVKLLPELVGQAFGRL